MAIHEREESSNSPLSTPSTITFFTLPPGIRHKIYDATFYHFPHGLKIRNCAHKSDRTIDREYLRIETTRSIPIKLLLLNKRITEEARDYYRNTCTHSLITGEWDGHVVLDFHAEADLLRKFFSPFIGVNLACWDIYLLFQRYIPMTDCRDEADQVLHDAIINMLSPTTDGIRKLVFRLPCLCSPIFI